MSVLLTQNNTGEREARRRRTRKGKTRYLKTLGKSPVLLTLPPVFWVVVSKEALSHQTYKGAWLEGGLQEAGASPVTCVAFTVVLRTLKTCGILHNETPGCYGCSGVFASCAFL